MVHTKRDTFQVDALPGYEVVIEGTIQDGDMLLDKDPLRWFTPNKKAIGDPVSFQMCVIRRSKLVLEMIERLEYDIKDYEGPATYGDTEIDIAKRQAKADYAREILSYLK